MGLGRGAAAVVAGLVLLSTAGCDGPASGPAPASGSSEVTPSSPGPVPNASPGTAADPTGEPSEATDSSGSDAPATQAPADGGPGGATGDGAPAGVPAGPDGGTLPDAGLTGDQGDLG